MNISQRLWEPLKSPTVLLESAYKKNTGIFKPTPTLEEAMQKHGQATVLEQIPKPLVPQQKPRLFNALI